MPAFFVPVALPRSHSFAGSGAVFAGLYTLFQAADFLTVRRAAATDVGANAADKRVLFRAAEHDIGGGLADLGTGHHDTQMLLTDVGAAIGQALVHYRLEADAMTVETVLDAFPHLRTDRGVFHGVEWLRMLSLRIHSIRQRKYRSDTRCGCTTAPE